MILHPEQTGRQENDCIARLARSAPFTTSLTVWARLRRLRALSVSHSKSVSYGGFVWACRAINSPKRRFLARAVTPETPAFAVVPGSHRKDLFPTLRDAQEGLPGFVYEEVRARK